MRDPKERIRDILECIDRIARYSSRGRSAFEQDELIQNWFVRNLQILGEAARSLPAEVRDRDRSIPWAEIIGMRNILVHDYFGIDTEIVWQVVDVQLPKLKSQVAELLASLERESAE